MTPNDMHENDNDNEEEEQEEEEEGEQVRVSLRLSPEFHELHPHWRVSEAPLAVPSTLTRSGLSAVLRQLLAEQQNEALRVEIGAPYSAA